MIEIQKRQTRKKKILIILAIVLAILISLLLLVGFVLTDNNICGFAGMWGVVRLSLGIEYAQLSNNPRQIMIRSCNDNFFELIPDFFDICEVSGSLSFWGYIDGQAYHASGRAFSSSYWIVTFNRIESN